MTERPTLGNALAITMAGAALCGITWSNARAECSSSLQMFTQRDRMAEQTLLRWQDRLNVSCGLVEPHELQLPERLSLRNNEALHLYCPVARSPLILTDPSGGCVAPIPRPQGNTICGWTTNGCVKEERPYPPNGCSSLGIGWAYKKPLGSGCIKCTGGPPGKRCRYQDVDWSDGTYTHECIRPE